MTAKLNHVGVPVLPGTVSLAVVWICEFVVVAGRRFLFCGGLTDPEK